MADLTGPPIRTAVVADLPALRETMPELANYDVSTWLGAFYPARTPEAAVRALNAEIKALLDMPETQQRLTAIGAELTPMTQAQFQSFHDTETKRYAEVIRTNQSRLD